MADDNNGEEAAAVEVALEMSVTGSCCSAQKV